MSGFGAMACGTGPYGIGTPAVAPTPGGLVLHDPNTNVQQSGRLIDPYLKQYVIDSNGRQVGMTEAQQLVYLAVRTTQGLSIVQSLGNQMSKVQTIGPDFVAKVTAIWTNALQPIVNRKLISIVGIDVTRDPNKSPTRAVTVIRWKDLTTQLEEKTTV